MDETFDWIVVGSGGGSMCSALVMRSLGRSVVILEKTDLIGGSTAMSGGVLWIPNNRFNREAGIEDSTEKGIEYLEKLVADPEPGRGTSPARRSAYVVNAPRMIDFLCGQGVALEGTGRYPDYYDNRPGGIAEGRTVGAKPFDVNSLGKTWSARLRVSGLTIPLRITQMVQLSLIKKTWRSRAIALKLAWRLARAKLLGQRLVGTGAALQGRMLAAALKAGVELRVNAPVTRLIVEDDRVTGVIVTDDSGERRFHARLGVLINAGGFARNQRMRDRYQPGSSAAWTNANPGDTGEMIEEALRIGGSVDMMNESWWQANSLPPGHQGLLPMHTGDLTKPHGFLVDGTGQRFCNEAASYMEVGQAQYARDRAGFGAIPAWLIIDSQHRNSYPLYMMPPGRVPQKWIDSGFIKTAGTIEDLARQCGIDPAGLKATQERFNRFVAAGKDDDFDRGGKAYDSYFADPTNQPSPTLGDVSSPPFYALQIYPGDVGTAGGIVADEYGRALTEAGDPIPGLYATGNSSAPVMGRYYVGAGTSIGASFTFGYIAARHAANADNLAA